MTTPSLPALPHVQLGNVLSDIGQAGTGFVQGLIQQRLRQQQIAMQQALQQAQIAHLGAETRYQDELGGAIPSEIATRQAQAANLGERTTQIQSEDAPADASDVLRLRQVSGYEHVPDDFYKGMTKGQFNDYVKQAMSASAMANRMMLTSSLREIPMYGPGGEGYIVRPGLPGTTPQVSAVPGGIGKEVSPVEMRRAGLGRAAEQSNNDLTRIENSTEGPAVLAEVARALQGPALARMLPFVGQGMEEAMAQLRMLGLSPAAQEYVKRLYDHASLVAPDRYGRQFRNPAILHQAWMDFGAGQFGITSSGIQATQRNRQNSLQAIAADPRAWGLAGQAFEPPAQPADPYSKYDQP